MGSREPMGPFAHHQPIAPLRVWADAPFPVRRMVRSLSASSWRDKKVAFLAMHSATLSPGEVVRKGSTSEPMVLGPSIQGLLPSASVTRQSLCGLAAEVLGDRGGWVWVRGADRPPTSQALSCPAMPGTLLSTGCPQEPFRCPQWRPAHLPVATTLVCHLDVDALAATPALRPGLGAAGPGTLHLLRPGPSSEDAGSAFTVF